MTRSRHRARERALALLYEAETKDNGVSEVLAALPVPADPFVLELVEGVEANRGHIDELIARHAVGWSVERMPSVDRNVLRMAVFELSERPGTPVAAVIDEAVELAKSYSTEQSGRFVNGVLAGVEAELGGTDGTASGGTSRRPSNGVRPAEGATIEP